MDVVYSTLKNERFSNLLKPEHRDVPFLHRIMLYLVNRYNVYFSFISLDFVPNTPTVTAIINNLDFFIISYYYCFS